MAASLFYLIERLGISVRREVSPRALQYIRDDLNEKPIWTAASWSNYYPFKALIDSGATLNDPAISKAANWFLKAQDSDGKWMQVSRVHDTAMAVLALSTLLTTPLVNVTDPRTGILNVSRENGTIRISFHGPGTGAIAPAEKLKISDQVRAELSRNQQLIVAALGRVRGKSTTLESHGSGQVSAVAELEKAGRYAFGHLIPARI